MPLPTPIVFTDARRLGMEPRPSLVAALRKVKMEEGALVEGDKLKDQIRSALEAEKRQIEEQVLPSKCSSSSMRVHTFSHKTKQVSRKKYMRTRVTPVSYLFTISH